MARAGDVIENPLQGQRIHFRATSSETGGAMVVFDAFVAPGGFVPLAHRHWRQAERFEVLTGQIACRVGMDRPRMVGAGEVLLLPANTPHIWWNPGACEAHAVVELRPALEFDTFLETLFGLARDGKTNARGSPGILQAAVLARRYRCYLAQPPVTAQRPLVALAAFIGNRLGHRDKYARYSETA